MTETKKKPESMARLVIVLFVIALITALLLGLVNFITADRIDAIKLEKTQKAMTEVLPADSYEPVEYSGGDKLVKAVYQAVSGANTYGYVVEVVPSGFGGAINMVVGIDMNGTVTGLAITSMSETSGLGTLANREEFREQYIGGTGDFAVNKDGGEIDALTGATVTSRAVTDGVNAAVEAVKTMG